MPELSRKLKWSVNSAEKRMKRSRGKPILASDVVQVVLWFAHCRLGSEIKELTDKVEEQKKKVETFSVYQKFMKKNWVVDGL